MVVLAGPGCHGQAECMHGLPCYALCADIVISDITKCCMGMADLHYLKGGWFGIQDWLPGETLVASKTGGSATCQSRPKSCLPNKRHRKQPVPSGGSARRNC